MFGRLLPRHLEIVYEINARFMGDVRERFPDDHARQRRMSLIDDHAGGSVRMANLATVGSFSVNGVSALHTELLKTRIMPDFDEFYPGKFNNKTNGVTPRRFVALANPELAELILPRTLARRGSPIWTNCAGWRGLRMTAFFRRSGGPSRPHASALPSRRPGSS
jgi:starch phosphorylase